MKKQPKSIKSNEKKEHQKEGKKKKYLTGYEYGDFFLFGLIFVAMIKFGYPIARSFFGIE